MPAAEAQPSAVSTAEVYFSAVSTAEVYFSAMGSSAHVLVVASDAAHADRLVRHSRRRVEELQRRWSRFESDSEVSRLNRQRTLTHLSPDTMTLLRAARTAWAATDGLFDPTMAGVLNLLGYDRDFRELMAPSDDRDASPMSHAVGNFIAGGLGQMILDEGEATVRLPGGAQFDPGGIGKGLAADVVCRELMELGAVGALVNLGGDLRVMGSPPPASSDPGESAWAIDIEHPLRPASEGSVIARAVVSDGAVASSSTLRRRWTGANGVAHHVLDPHTGAPAQFDIVAATVIAAEAWWAEALTKALLLGGSPELLRGGAALVVHRDGRIDLLGDHEQFFVLGSDSGMSPGHVDGRAGAGRAVEQPLAMTRG